VRTETEPQAALASVRYWDRVVGVWTARQKDALWRAHSDAVNLALVAKGLSGRRLRYVLKTDLFDEAVSDGLYPLIQSHATKVVGIDLSPKVVGAAHARYPLLKAVSTDVLQLPFATGQFDAVISCSTLDHFESADEIRLALCELHRVLRPGGTLVITLDNASNPAVALRNWLPYEWLHRTGLVPYRVGTTCTASGFMTLLRSCHFDLGDVTFILHVPRAIAVVLSRLIQRFGGLATRRRFLRLLASSERLDSWPTRKLTGYFIAAVGTKS
jgi:SAM-dependent methyltransferase